VAPRATGILLDQIAMSDALTLLQREHRQLTFALEHEPSLAERYAALMGLFAAQAEAIAEGMARAARAPSPVPAGAANDAAAEE
jgi:hypothetical protein